MYRITLLGLIRPLYLQFALAPANCLVLFRHGGARETYLIKHAPYPPCDRTAVLLAITAAGSFSLSLSLPGFMLRLFSLFLSLYLIFIARHGCASAPLFATILVVNSNSLSLAFSLNSFNPIYRPVPQSLSPQQLVPSTLDFLLFFSAVVGRGRHRKRETNPGISVVVFFPARSLTLVYSPLYTGDSP